MRTLKCSCCGEDVTMPKWNDRKPYGYTCFARLFGKSKASRYVPAEGWVRIIRRWDDHMANMSPEGKVTFAGKAMINFSHPEIPVKKVVGVTDHGIQHEDGTWWVPDDAMKALISTAKKKFNIVVAQKAGK